MIDRIVRFMNAVSFHRGLALGALVGAAIAGSTIWSRLRGPRDERASEHPTEHPSERAPKHDLTAG